MTPDALRGATLSDVLAQDHAAVGRVVDEINAEAAHPGVAQALAVESNSPILRRERIIHDLSGRPVIYVVSRSSGLRSRMLMEADAADCKMARIIARKHRYAILPWQMALVGHLMKLIPASLWDWAMKKAPHNPRLDWDWL